MEKIVILSFLFLACVVLRTSGQKNETSSVPLQAATIAPTNSTALDVSSSVAPTPTATEPGEKPTSGAVNVKALAGFVASFALIALF